MIQNLYPLNGIKRLVTLRNAKIVNKNKKTIVKLIYVLYVLKNSKNFRKKSIISLK